MLFGMADSYDKLFDSKCKSNGKITSEYILTNAVASGLGKRRREDSNELDELASEV